MYMTLDSVNNGEHPYYSFHKFQIYIDSERQNNVVALDTLGTLHEPRGWVERYIADEDGYPKAVGGELVTEIVYGKVEIKV